MAAGIIPVTSIPGWPLPDPALTVYCQKQLVNAGFPPTYHFAPDGLHVADVPTVNTAFTTFSGSADELKFYQTQKQNELDAFFDANFVLTEFIRNGTITTVTGTNVGAFLAQITNNYRNLRAQISASTTVAQVNAINVHTGWPANP